MLVFSKYLITKELVQQNFYPPEIAQLLKILYFQFIYCSKQLLHFCQSVF